MATTSAPPIAAGLPYSTVINVAGYPDGEPPFPTGCELIAHARDFAKSRRINAVLTMGDGITWLDEDSIQIDMTAAQTALCKNTTCTIDFARTDVDPVQYTYVQAIIDVIVPATRGL